MSENGFSIHVTEAEMIGDGVLISFTDGRTALFAASFLYSHIDEAVEVFENEEGK